MKPWEKPYATSNGNVGSDVQEQRRGSDAVVQDEGEIRELGPNKSGGGEETDSGSGVRETEGKQDNWGYVELEAVKELIRAEAEEIAREAKHGDLLKTIDRAAKAIATSLREDDGDAKVSSCIDAQTAAIEKGFAALVKCVDRNTSVLEKIAKAEAREVRVEMRQEKDAGIAALLRELVAGQTKMVEAIAALAAAEKEEEKPATSPPSKPTPMMGHHFEIERDGNGQMVSVRAIPLRPHPITGKVI